MTTQPEQSRRAARLGPLVVFGAVVVLFAVVVITGLAQRGGAGLPTGLIGWLAAVVMAALYVKQSRRAEHRQTELNETRSALAISSGRFDALIRHAADVMIILTPTGTCIYISPSAQWVLGVQPETAVGRPLDVLLGSAAQKVLAQVHEISELPGLVASAEIQLTQPNGTPKVIEARLSNLVHDLSVGGIVLHLADITDRKSNEQHLKRQAGLDALTGLLNRSKLDEVLTAQWSDHIRRNRSFAVLFADLDGFKSVNDRFGHEAGDEVLREVGQRLRDVVRGEDLVIRYGGDEFVIICPNTDDEQSKVLATRFQDIVRRPILLANGVAEVGVSIGIALGPGNFTDVEALMRHADEAMYQVKGARSSQTPQ